jgi:phosphoglycerate kinase
VPRSFSIKETTMNKKTIKDINWQGKRALVRVDFNVPQDKNTGAITDDARIRAALPTIQYLLDHGAAVVLMSHLGRPKEGPDPKYSMKVTADHLASLLPGVKVKFTGATTGPEAEAAANALKPGEILVLENTRFDKRETKNDEGMAKEFAKLGDVYVMDAFGSAHRAHASTEGVAHYLPAVAGFLMEKELEYLGGALENPRRPFVAILGGAKISDKIGVISNLLTKVDRILIGGGMANTFLAAQGYNMGKSLVEAEVLEKAKELIASGADKIELPVDLRVASAFWRWTLAPPPSHTIPTIWQAPTPWCGTGPWAYLSSQPSPAAPWPSPRSSADSRMPPPLSAAATALQPFATPALKKRCRTSLPAAAPPSSFWKASNCPVWQR